MLLGQFLLLFLHFSRLYFVSDKNCGVCSDFGWVSKFKEEEFILSWGGVFNCGGVEGWVVIWKYLN